MIIDESKFSYRDTEDYVPEEWTFASNSED